MIAPQRFRKKPVEVDAMRWDATDPTAEGLWEWTLHTIATKDDGTSHMVSTQFMVLQDWANSDARDTFGRDEEQRRVDEGYTAVVYDRLHGTWVNVATGDWIIRGVEGEFYPCKPDVFEATYESVVPS